MFGMGGTEILVILIVALLFLGPDKLPEAAKTISKGIRDIKKQSRVLQRTIEDDEHIGGAIRDLKSALRGEDEPFRPKPYTPPPQLVESTAQIMGTVAGAALPEPGAPDALGGLGALGAPGTPEHGAGPDAPAADPQPSLTMPPSAGEPDEGAPAPSASDDAELAAMVKPAADTIPHEPPAAVAASFVPADTSEPPHG